MRLGVVVESKSSSQISSEMLHLLDILDELGIDCFLGGLGLSSPFLFTLFILLNSLQAGLRGVLELAGSVGFSGREEFLVDFNVYAVEWDFGGGGDGIGSIDSLEWDSVNGVGPGN